MTEAHAVLFDIDGTLLVTGGAGGVAWQRAFEELHGVDADVAEHTDAGMTDPEIAAIIFREVIGPRGRSGRTREGDRRLPAPPARRGRRVRRLPVDAGHRGGARPADRRRNAARPRHRQHRAGRPRQARPRQPQPLLQLRRLRLRLGRPHRGDEGGPAARRAGLGGTLGDGGCFSVGDTPRDVQAGHGAGIRVVGVATGKYSVEELRDSGADWALATLEDGLPA